uniref:TACC_C domain-containing protein n=1 Tax=Elaeophora elaphi TaxID=1147741 RepID=A0A0R3RVC2_9BILA
MSFIGERSRFSCLKIYDDTSSSNDDDNGAKSTGGTAANSQTKNHRNQKKSPATYKSGGLIVHAIPQKRKNRNKKTKKMSNVVEGGFGMQDGDGDSVNKTCREDLQQVTENNREMPSTASVDPMLEIALSNELICFQFQLRMEDESAWKDEVKMLISEVDSQASAVFTKNDGPQKIKEQYLVALYRSKLVETLRQMMLGNEVKLKAEEEVVKYKGRYKKLCELLKDAEGEFHIFILILFPVVYGTFITLLLVNEKAHMAADLEKARTVEQELSSQIGELRGELMQARSKIRELEMKYKELASKQQH